MARYFHNIIKGFNVDNQNILLRRLVQEGTVLLSKDIDPELKQITLENIVQDVAAALCGREISFGDVLTAQYPNGVRDGENKLLNEELMYYNLPEVMTSQDIKAGQFWMEDE